SPSGPFTITRPGEIETLTPLGSSMGCLPIRLIRSLPDEAHDFAADSSLLRRPRRDQAAGCRQDRHAHPAEHARQPVLARVDTAAGLGHPLQVGDDPFAAPAVLQLDHEGIEAFAFLDVVVRDVALLLEDASDLLLQAGGRHLGLLVQRLVGVADAREHVCDRIGQHGYQLLFVMPGITPWCASSRRQIRQSPNLRKTARGRPHRLQREYARTGNFCGRDCLIRSDFFATYCSLSANGSPRPRRSASAWSSDFAVVVIATSRPRTCWMSS